MPFALRLGGGLALLGLLYVAVGPLNAVLRVIFDVVLAPFRGLHPAFGLTLLAVPFAILALLLFKWTSDQKALDRIKAKIHAGLFEIRLFNDDLGAIFRAQGSILGNNVIYFSHNLVPLLWMIGPFVLAIGQIQMHYGFAGLEPGKTALVKVQLAEDFAAGGRPDVALDLPAGLAATTPAVWMPARSEALWRIEAEQAGDYEMTVRAGGQEFTKSVRVGDERGRRSPMRVGQGFFDQILYPAEAPLPKGAPVQSISLEYAGAGATFVGLSVWVWVWTLLTMVIAFALRGKFGVTI